MNDRKTEFNEGSQIIDFVRLFTVEPTPGNRGQLLLRKDSVKSGKEENLLALNASCFFACGLTYGATVMCSSMAELDQRFHAFTQEDADAISRHSIKDVYQYLNKILLDQVVEIVPKNIKLPSDNKK